MSKKSEKAVNPNRKKIMICVVAAVVCIVVAYLIMGAALGSLNPAKWGKDEPRVLETDNSIYCAVYYPDLQSDGAIWQTGGMAQTSAANLRECLESDFDEGFFKFADDGTLVSVGELKAANGYHFTIQRNTTRTPEPLSDKPEEITLADSETYEIRYCDPAGEDITRLTAEIEEKVEEVKPSESNESSDPSEAVEPSVGDESSDPTEDEATGDDPSKETSPTENKETENKPNGDSTDPTKPTSSTTPTEKETERETLPATADTDNIGDGSIFD